MLDKFEEVAMMFAKAAGILFSAFLFTACGVVHNNFVDAFAIPHPTLTRLSVKKGGKSQIVLQYSPEDTEEKMRKREFREEEPLYDHDDWVHYRTRRGDDSENIATAMFGGFVLFLWMAAFQV